MAAEFEAPEAAGDESERERAAAMELGFWLDRPQSADDNGTKTVEWEDAMFYGMVIHNPDGHGVFVTHVEPDGVAAKQGIQLGWGLVAINGKAVPDDVSDAKIGEVFHGLPRPIVLQFRTSIDPRYRAPPPPGSPAPPGVTISSPKKGERKKSFKSAFSSRNRATAPGI